MVNPHRDYPGYGPYYSNGDGKGALSISGSGGDTEEIAWYLWSNGSGDSSELEEI